MFLQFFLWGAWYVTLGPFMNAHGMSGESIGNAYTVGPLAAILAPVFLGMIADRFFPSQVVLGVLHAASETRSKMIKLVRPIEDVGLVWQSRRGGDIERQRRLVAVHEHGGPWTDRMAHTELVEDIRVVERHVCDHEVGGDQPVEHVLTDIAGFDHRTGRVAADAGSDQCRLDQYLLDRVEVDP